MGLIANNKATTGMAGNGTGTADADAGTNTGAASRVSVETAEPTW